MIDHSKAEAVAQRVSPFMNKGVNRPDFVQLLANADMEKLAALFASKLAAPVFVALLWAGDPNGVIQGASELKPLYTLS